jgi:hypothetical protein
LVGMHRIKKEAKRVMEAGKELAGEYVFLAL